MNSVTKIETFVHFIDVDFKVLKSHKFLEQGRCWVINGGLEFKELTYYRPKSVEKNPRKPQKSLKIPYC